MIIDAHTSVPPDWLRSSMRDSEPYKTVTIHGLLEHMEKSGVDRAVLFSVARKPEHVRGINDFIADECKKRPDKFIGFANIHPPNLKEALDEIDRAAGELNMAGLKIHPIVQNFRLDHPTVPEVLEKAKEYGFPIIIHVSSPVHEYNLEGEIFTEDRALELQRKAEKERGGNAAAAYLVKVMDHYDDWNLQSAHMGGIAL